MLNPLNGGNVIWAMSDSYQSMMSSGQIALTNGEYYTRLHPSAITVGDDDNQVLTQKNFAAHAYRRIKSWVKLWVADWITVSGKKHTIWKGIDKGAFMGKLRDLAGQGQTDYTYNPGNNDDYGDDEGAEGDGIDLGDYATIADLQMSQEQMQNIINSHIDQPITITPTQPNIGDITTTDPDPGTLVGDDSKHSTTTSGMLTFTEAWEQGLGPKSGNYKETAGTRKGGYDGHIYTLKIYLSTGKKHWYR